MPEVEWWEVFDCEREELGFLVVGMGSVAGIGEAVSERWPGLGMIRRVDVEGRLGREGEGEEDEEMAMARMLDEKVAGVA